MKIEAAVRGRLMGELSQALMMLRARLKEFEAVAARAELVAAAIQELKDGAAGAEVLTDPARRNAVMGVLIQRPYVAVADLIPRFRQEAMRMGGPGGAKAADQKKKQKELKP
jgi:hypothetical protein